MQPIPLPDKRFTDGAEGWLMLGNLVEAKAELKCVSSRFHEHPDFLALRWQICAKEEDWAEAFTIAEKLLKHLPNEPQSWLWLSFAARRMPGGSIEQSKQHLLVAAKKFPKEAIIPYNLACYEAQLNDLKAASVWLEKAFKLGEPHTLKQMALNDPDLKLFWPKLSED
jgi:predicted Zn-dependent protease